MAQAAEGIPVVLMGLGRVGRAIARAALERADLRIVGAVDPAHAGRRLDEVLGAGAPALEVAKDPAAALKAGRGGVVLHATGSSFALALPQLERAVGAGLSVASACEELAYPWLRHEKECEALDRACEAKDVAVVGVGSNPGFALDRLPAFLSQVMGHVRHVRATRVQEAAGSPGLLRKAGAGLGEDAFHEALERGEVGHVGLVESAALAALGCGFELDEVEEDVEPVLASEDLVRPGEPTIRAGQVCGYRQVVRGFADGAERVQLEVLLAAGAEDPRDEVELDGDRPIRALLRGGLPDEEATAWAVVNAAPALVMMRGLVTILDLPAGR